MRWSTMKDLRNFAKPALILLTVAKKMASQEARRLHRTVMFAKAPLGVQLLKQLPPPCVLTHNASIYRYQLSSSWQEQEGDREAQQHLGLMSHEPLKTPWLTQLLCAKSLVVERSAQITAFSSYSTFSFQKHLFYNTGYCSGNKLGFLCRKLDQSTPRHML